MNKLEIAAVKIGQCLNRAFPGSKTSFFSSAIVTCAGSGTRMGGVSKQLIDLNGMPLFLYSLLAFEHCNEISEIIVVAKENEIGVIQDACKQYSVTKLRCVVKGGASRQESVYNGFLAVDPKSEFVAIHDGARPLIRPEDVALLLKEARRFGAATAAKKMVDTVKRSTADGTILDTVPREDLYTVQTPQVFKTDLYRVSLALNEKNGGSVTDDCALAEAAGFSVKLCDLGINNLKLTHPEDLPLIEMILKERNHG